MSECNCEACIIARNRIERAKLMLNKPTDCITPTLYMIEVLRQEKCTSVTLPKKRCNRHALNVKDWICLECGEDVR